MTYLLLEINAWFYLQTLFVPIYYCLLSTNITFFHHMDIIVYPCFLSFFLSSQERDWGSYPLHSLSFLSHLLIHVPSSHARLAIFDYIEFSIERLSSHASTAVKLPWSINKHLWRPFCQIRSICLLIPMMPSYSTVCYVCWK